jgi:hypothetical protein
MDAECRGWFRDNVVDHVECGVQDCVEMLEIRRTDVAETVRPMFETCILECFAILRNCVPLVSPSLIRLRVLIRDKEPWACDNQDFSPVVGHIMRVENPLRKKSAHVRKLLDGETVSSQPGRER